MVEVLALAVPHYPQDFKALVADGGFYYRHWHPDAPADYDGTWSAKGEEAPPWSGGLWVYDDEDDPSRVIVVWEFGPELESGPYESVLKTEVDLGIERVMAEVNRERLFATPDV